MVHQIAGGRRYGVVSDSNMYHGLLIMVRGLPPTESYRDNGNFKYHEAYTYPLTHPHKAKNNTDDSRHEVSLPEDDDLFDIQRSGVFCSLWSAWETKVEKIYLSSGYYIKVPKDIVLGRLAGGKASQNNLAKIRQERKVKPTSKNQMAYHLTGPQEKTSNNKLVKGRQENNIKK